MDDPLDFQFKADKYGPFSFRLRHMLNGFDGTYLHCDKRLSEAGQSDTIRFDEKRRPHLDLYLIHVETPTEIIAQPGQTLLLLGAAGRRIANRQLTDRRFDGVIPKFRVRL